MSISIPLTLEPSSANGTIILSRHFGMGGFHVGIQLVVGVKKISTLETRKIDEFVDVLDMLVEFSLVEEFPVAQSTREHGPLVDTFKMPEK